MRHLPQPQRAGQAGAALERVQRAQDLVAGAAVVRTRGPLPQRAAQLGHQFLRLLVEDREQVGIDGVGDVDVAFVRRLVVHVEAGRLRRPGIGGRGQHRARLRLPALGLVRRPVLGRQHADPEAAAFAERHRRLFDLQQRFDDVGIGLLEKARGELVQQAADFLGGVRERLRQLPVAHRHALRPLQGGLEGTRDPGKGVEPHRGRTAAERVRQADRGVGDRAIELERPFGDLGGEPPRPLVGFVEVDVVERDADAQRPDHLDLLVGVPEFFFLGARVLRFGRHAGVDRRLLAGLQPGRLRLRLIAAGRRRHAEVAQVQRELVHRDLGADFEAAFAARQRGRVRCGFPAGELGERGHVDAFDLKRGR